MAPATILKRLTPGDIPVIRRDPVDAAAREVAVPIVEEVKARGEAAVREYALKFGEISSPDEDIVLGRDVMEEAWTRLDAETKNCLIRTAHRVRRFAVRAPC